MKRSLIDSNPVLKLSFEFALMVIEYTALLEEQRKYVIAQQLLKSGTSIGANAMEAQNAESRMDFVHKMKIAAKEAEETQYWLLLCEYSSNFPDCSKLVAKLEEVHRILNSIITTSKKNINA